MSDDRAAKARARLTELVDPAHTAVLTMEMQKGIIAGDALFMNLVDEVTRLGIREKAGRVCTAARAAGVRCVHGTAVTRPDGAGIATNCVIFANNEKLRIAGKGTTNIGDPGADLIDEIGQHPEDIEVPRLHGMTPFTSTALDQILRNLGVTTVVVMGVSLNLGIPGALLGALDRGYQCVLVRDAVAGVPYEYGQAVIDNSLYLISTLTTSEEIIDIWSNR